MTDTGTQSLKHMALVKIAAILWNQEIRAVTQKFHLQVVGWSFNFVFRLMEDKIIKQLAQISQPRSLMKNILGLIKPIGIQILTWIRHHKEFLSIVDVQNSLNSLFWTPQGTVDKKKTAKVLIKDDNLDVTVRYKLACIYCLEADVPKLWNKIPEIVRNSFYSEENPIMLGQQKLVFFWTYDINGDVARINNMIEQDSVIDLLSYASPYVYAFEKAALFCDNKVAAEYFLQKLTSREREESLVSSAIVVTMKMCIDFGTRSDYADVLCFLLSQMDQEQQIKVFIYRPCEVLKFFLEWPCQSLFMKTANRMWDFLSEEVYEELLEVIVDKLIDGFTDWDYQELFREFWQQSHSAHKSYVIENEFYSAPLLAKLFEINDEKNIELILKDLYLMEHKKLIFFNGGLDICQNLVYADNWDLLKFLIRECISSKREIIKFRKIFKETRKLCSKEELGKTKDKWDKFFQLLDVFICGYNKRSVEGSSNPAKRLCSIEFQEETKNIG